MTINIRPTIYRRNRRIRQHRITNHIIRRRMFQTKIQTPSQPINQTNIPNISHIIRLSTKVNTNPNNITSLIPRFTHLSNLKRLTVNTTSRHPINVLTRNFRRNINRTSQIIQILTQSTHMNLKVPINIVNQRLSQVGTLTNMLRRPISMNFQSRHLLNQPSHNFRHTILHQVNHVFDIHELSQANNIHLLAVPLPSHDRSLIRLRLILLKPHSRQNSLLLLSSLPISRNLSIKIVRITSRRLNHTPHHTTQLSHTHHPITSLRRPRRTQQLTTTQRLFPLTTRKQRINTNTQTMFRRPHLTSPRIRSPTLIRRVITSQLSRTNIQLKVLVNTNQLSRLTNLRVSMRVTLQQPISTVNPIRTNIRPLKTIKHTRLTNRRRTRLIMMNTNIKFHHRVTTLPTPVNPNTNRTIGSLPNQNLTRRTINLKRHNRHHLIKSQTPRRLKRTLFTRTFRRHQRPHLTRMFLYSSVQYRLTPTLKGLSNVITRRSNPIQITSFQNHNSRISLTVHTNPITNRAPFSLRPIPPIATLNHPI